MAEVTCGCAGNTCTGCASVPDGGVKAGFTDTVMVIGLLQFDELNVTVGGVVPTAAWKRGSAELTSVLPSVSTLIVTSASGCLVSCNVYVSGCPCDTIVLPSGCSTSTPPESPSITSTLTGGLSTTPLL